MDAGAFPEKPSVIHKIALDGEPSGREPGWVPLDIVLRGATHEARKTPNRWSRSFNRPLLMGDVNGDARTDLLLGQTPEGSDVFVGVPSPNLFALFSQPLTVDLPSDGEYMWLTDANNDGTQDLLIHDPSATEQNNVTILLSR